MLTDVTICYQTVSGVGVDFRHFHIICESLKGMRINFICNTRISIIINFWKYKLNTSLSNTRVGSRHLKMPDGLKS